MITVSLDQIITDNESAYLGVLNAIISIYNSDLLRDDDFICFNIGSPIICRTLNCDKQPNMPTYDEVFVNQYEDFNTKVRE